MLVSTYRNQVDRILKEIADLESRQARERGRATEERGKSLRTANSITATTSPSMVRSRLNEAHRREQEAVKHEKAAADLAKRIADKRRSLTSAQTQLDRAVKSERGKEERSRKREREEDLRHLRSIEQARRGSASLELAQPSWRTSGAGADRSDAPTYDVCLSFAGEDRAYVEMVARELKGRGVKVFYDRDEASALWGKDLVEHFDSIYRKQSRFCLMFVSEAYAAKSWTRLERRSALARALESEAEYVLPARFDDTELPGLPPTVGYIDLNEFAPATLVDLLLEKLDRAGDRPLADSEGDGGGDENDPTRRSG